MFVKVLELLKRIEAETGASASMFPLNDLIVIRVDWWKDGYRAQYSISAYDMTVDEDTVSAFIVAMFQRMNEKRTQTPEPHTN